MEAGSTTDKGRQAPEKGRLSTLARSEKATTNALITPSRLVLAFVVLFPAAVAIYIGFTEWSPVTGDQWWEAYKSWVWFDQYWSALNESSFWLAIWRTVLITGVAVSVEFILGLALGLLFVENFRGRGLLTVVFLMPMMVVPAVSGFIFFMLLQRDGPVNDALSIVLPGDVSIGWLQDPNIAPWSVMMVDIWQWTPLMFLILLAGLVAVPEDQLNQARVLGAGFYHRLRYIMVPMLKPVILIAIIIRAMETLKLFDQSWLLTRGGPGEASSTISVYLFREVFQNARWGFASAAAILILIFVSVLAIFAIRPIERAQDETLEEMMVESALGDDEQEATSIPGKGGDS
jgi:multiple sugar transport system permease protein